MSEIEALRAEVKALRDEVTTLRRAVYATYHGQVYQPPAWPPVPIYNTSAVDQ